MLFKLIAVMEHPLANYFASLKKSWPHHFVIGAFIFVLTWAVLFLLPQAIGWPVGVAMPAWLAYALTAAAAITKEEYDRQTKTQLAVSPYWHQSWRDAAWYIYGATGPAVCLLIVATYS